jgi:gas vesicle protein
MVSGIMIGLLIGCIIGVLVAPLCVGAKSADVPRDRYEYYLGEQHLKKA